MATSPESEKTERTDPKQRRTGSPRKPYRRPELSFYGDISQITRGNQSTHAGDAGGGATKMCWIAEALYGVDAPRTQLVRAWLNDAYSRRIAWALVAVPLYRRFGVRVARGLRTNALVEQVCRRMFDYAVRCAHHEYAAYAGSLRTSISPSA